MGGGGGGEGSLGNISQNFLANFVSLRLFLVTFEILTWNSTCILWEFSGGARILKRGVPVITSGGSIKKWGGAEEVGLQSSPACIVHDPLRNFFITKRFKGVRNRSHGVCKSALDVLLVKSCMCRPMTVDLTNSP